MSSIATLTPTQVEAPLPLEVDLRPAPESRPAAHRWKSAGRPSAVTQPTLIDALHELLDETATTPRPRGMRVHPDRGPGAVPPAAGLPEPTGWAAVLGMAIGQALVGARPVGQLQSWLDPVVLADLRHSVRSTGRPDPRARSQTRSRSGPLAAAPPIRVVPVRVLSVRAQCPTPTAAETTIHLLLGGRSICLGARLQAHGRRWVCTDLGAGPAVLSWLPSARDTA